MKAVASVAVGVAALVSGPVGASCGASFCTANSNWETQETGATEGLRLDARFEYVDQDQPLAGDSKVGVGEIRQHHDEVRTINRNLLLGADYAFSPAWSLGVKLPLIEREHLHVHNHRGTPIPESWELRGLGDAQVTVRHARPHPRDALAGVRVGLKLPTGSFDETSSSGLAERTLQLGTGTTDAIVAAYYQRALEPGVTSAFTQLTLQTPLNKRDDYQPGTQVALDVGGRYALGERIAAMLQLNTLFKERDRGGQAEPANTGGLLFALTPGMSFALGRHAQIYTFLQQPLYQYVNGVQLTADRAFVLGVNILIP